MTGMFSFKKLLKKYLKAIKPKTILEWGPGMSTIIMAKECPKAKIYSIEHNIVFYQRYRDLFAKNKMVVVHHVPNLELYSEIPVHWNKKFDLIFVDGFDGRRVACLKTALKVVSTRGLVLLHDSEREKYKPGLKGFRWVDNQDGTLVLAKK